jgi:FtsH-binding integral membrane protein
MLAAILTSVMVITLTVYACFTEIDYTKLLPYMIIGCIILLAASICAMFIKIPILHTIISAVMVFFFSIYLIVDTQLIMGGRSYELSMDDYVLGAIILYVDIITIFIEILKLVGDKH